jgi:hypothetical protein
MKTTKLKALCEDCGRETNHDVIHDYEIGENDEYYWHSTYQIIRCCGCDTISFREETITEDDYDPFTGKPGPAIKLYPPRIAGRKPLDNNYHLPTNIRRIYREVLSTLNNSSVILAAIGLRTLIEAICIDQEVKGKNLEKKIDGLHTQGILSEKQAKILHTHRFLGNVATHEITAAKPVELVTALDIAETLLKTIYILPELEKEIKTGKKDP